MGEDSSFLAILKNRINLVDIPFTDRGSRLLIFKEEQHLNIRLAERWYKRTGDLSAYRRRPPLVDNWYFTDGNGNRLESTLTSYPDRLE